MFSNFKLTANASINLYLGGTTAAVQPLIDAAFPATLTLATQIVGATTAPVASPTPLAAICTPRIAFILALQSSGASQKSDAIARRPSACGSTMRRAQAEATHGTARARATRCTATTCCS